MEKSKDYGMFLLAIPVVGAMLVLFWVGNMALIEGPASKLTLVGLMTVLATAAVVYLEAKAAEEANGGPLEGVFSSTKWTILVALLWIVGYPWYMKKRKAYGLKDLFVPAVVITVIFMVVTLAVNASIDSAVEELNRTLMY